MQQCKYQLVCAYYYCMIGEIIRQVYGDDESIIRSLIQIPIVAGSLFRSFDEFTQNLIFRMVTSDGQIEKRQIIGLMQRQKAKREGPQAFDDAMKKLLTLRIVTRSGFDNPLYKINSIFEGKLNDYIENPFRITGEEIPPDQFVDKDFFNLLGLLQESNQILRQCRIGRIQEGRLTRQNFDFIRLPLGYKISILIKGYLQYKRRVRNTKILRDVLCLSLARPGRRYRMNEKQEDIITQLQMLRLVKRIGSNYFTVSQYLYNFAFEEKSRESRLLDCDIIVETNFKVYVQLPKTIRQERNNNYQLIKNIMRLLLSLEHQDYKFEELIVGSITFDKMREIFDCKISVADYLSFFRTYMIGNLSIEKDLGRWNKIKFLGLEGPAEQNMIPNNIKQELKLWESLYRNRQRPQNYNYEGNQYVEQYDYYNRP